MKAHRLAEYFPIMEGEKFDKFVENIRDNGQLEPIITFDDKILDGMNRFRACHVLNIEPIFKEYKGSDPLQYVISLNIHRRHMSVSQLAMVATEMLPEFEEKAKERKWRSNISEGPRTLTEDEKGRAPDKVAEEFGISGKSIRRAKRVKEQAPEKVSAIIQGRETVKSVDTDLRMEAEKERKEKAIAEGRTRKTPIEMKLEEQEYIMTLESIISILPKQPPSDWSEPFFKLAQGYANIIINRLEVFNG